MAEVASLEHVPIHFTTFRASAWQDYAVHIFFKTQTSQEHTTNSYADGILSALSPSPLYSVLVCCYPLRCHVIRAPQVTLQPPATSFSLFSCPSCACKVHSYVLLNIVFPPLLQSAPFPYKYALQKPLYKNTIHLNVAKPPYFSFLSMVRYSSYFPTDVWIFLRTALISS